MNTAQCPTAIFEPTSEPERYPFTAFNASNGALGAVCLVGGRMATWPRGWGQEEQDPINPKEVIAPKGGFYVATLFGQPLWLSTLPPLSAGGLLLSLRQWPSSLCRGEAIRAKKKRCLHPGSNQRPLDLQSNALPTEL